MTNEFTPVVTDQYLAQASQWVEALNQGDNISILFFRLTDRLRRLHQFITEYNFVQNITSLRKKYFFLVLDSILYNNSIEDREDLQEHIAVQLNYAQLAQPKRYLREWVAYFKEQNIHLVLIIPQAEEFHNVIGHNIMSWLEFVVQQHDGQISIMSFYEADITNPENAALYSGSSTLEQRIFHYPLYDEADTVRFIRYLEHKWDITISQKQQAEILELCGGHFWYVKEAVREIRDSGNWSSGQADMQFRLNTLYQHLFPSEQSTLKKLTIQDPQLTDSEQHSLQYFQRMQFVNNHGICTVGLFKSFLLKQSLPEDLFLVKEGKVVYNNVPLEGFFSRKEYRVFRVLLEQKSQIVTRDQIAKIIWPSQTEKNYSDWAIDQLMARLRKRLVQLSISPECIKVVRGKGYRLTNG